MQKCAPDEKPHFIAWRFKGGGGLQVSSSDGRLLQPNIKWKVVEKTKPK